MEPKIETKKISDIEKTANFEGNDTLLLFQRLENPKIKERMIAMFLKYKDYSDGGYEYKTDENDEIIKIPIPDWKPITKDDVEEEIEENIKRASLSTGISLEVHPQKLGNQHEIFIFSKNPETGEKFTQKQLSIIEAHEKGHAIRGLSPLKKITEIASGFDFSKIEITPELQNAFKNENKEESIEEINEEIINYFSSMDEIVERMSQLKNYFGMKGDEIFTKEHLAYVKKHYMQDTGFTFQIKPFLDSITPETENKFLALINDLGI